MELQAKILKLRESLLKGEWSDDDGRIKEWENSLKILKLKEDLKDNPFIKAIVEECKYRIVQTNKALQSDDREISDGEAKKIRDRLLERRDSYRWFLQLFEGLGGEAELLETDVDKVLEDIGNNMI